MARRSGIVKFYNASRGFGFVAPDDGSQEIFVHFSNIQHDCLNGLMEGERVEFSTEYDDRKGKTKATFITGPTGLPVRGCGKGLTKGALKGAVAHAWNPSKGKGKGEFLGGSPMYGMKGKGKAGFGGPPMVGYANPQPQQLPPSGLSHGYPSNMHGVYGPPPDSYTSQLPNSYAPTGYSSYMMSYPPQQAIY